MSQGASEILSLFSQVPVLVEGEMTHDKTYQPCAAPDGSWGLASSLSAPSDHSSSPVLVSVTTTMPPSHAAAEAQREDRTSPASWPHPSAVSTEITRTITHLHVEIPRLTLTRAMHSYHSFLFLTQYYTRLTVVAPRAWVQPGAKA